MGLETLDFTGFLERFPKEESRVIENKNHIHYWTDWLLRSNGQDVPIIITD